MALVDTSKVDRLPVPHEEGQWVEVRALLATEMDEAKDGRTKRLLNMFEGDLPKPSESKDSPAVKVMVLEVLNKALGHFDLPPGVEQVINDALAKLPSEEPETLAQRVAQYDALTVLKHSVVCWSYAAPVELKNVERLDSVTRDWLVQEIVERNTRPLASVNGSGGISNWAGAQVSSSISTPSGEPE